MTNCRLPILRLTDYAYLTAFQLASADMKETQMMKAAKFLKNSLKVYEILELIYVYSNSFSYKMFCLKER